MRRVLREGTKDVGGWGEGVNVGVEGSRGR